MSKFIVAKQAIGSGLLALTLLSPLQAQAGRPCDPSELSVKTLRQGLAMSAKTTQVLDQARSKDGLQLAVLARAGEDLSTYGLRYSHAGLVYHDGTGWHVLHKLNQCGSAIGHVYAEGMGLFFLDDPNEYKALLLVPPPEIQQRVISLISNPNQRVAMQHQPYSMVSYAWGEKYQQSNQWLLETMAAAMGDKVDSRAKAQAWLKYQGYEPDVLTIRPLTRLGARTLKANVAFDDHPNAERFSDRIATVTVRSIRRWMTTAMPGTQAIELALN